MRKIARRLRYRLDLFICWIATMQVRWADFMTMPLTPDEWADLRARFPKIAKHHDRAILTAGETARLYRTEIAFEKLQAAPRAA